MGGDLINFFLAIGADILDSTNQNTFSFGHLKEEPTWLVILSFLSLA
jgi:hypothetical protein